MNVTNIYLSRHEDVKDLAERIGKDIGSLDLLTTDERANIVAAINELKGILSGVEIDLGDYATKDELTRAIMDLINGADADSDTLKELADKITALAQADKGLVSAASKQSFDSVKKETARKNIDAVSTTELNTAVDTLNSTHAKRSELEQAKTELSDSIEAKSSQLLGVITAEEATRKAEDEAIRGELALTDGKIQEAIDAIPEVDLTPFATKAEVAEDIGVLANLSTNNKTSVVASINEIFNGVDNFFDDVGNAIESLETAVGEQFEQFALKSELTPFATKVELTKAVTDLINGADVDSDTLKELADKITALAQADNGLVSALEPQEFNETRKKQARDNIDAVSTNELEAQKENLLEDIGNLTNLPTADKTSVVASISEIVNEVTTVIDAIDTTINDIYTEVVSDYAKKTDLTPLATKTAVAKDIGKLADLPTPDKTSVVASINEIFVWVDGIKTFINNLEDEIYDEFAKKTDLTPLATKAEVSKDIGDLSDLPTPDKTSVVASFKEIVNSLNTTFEEVDDAIQSVSNYVTRDYAKKTDLTPLATKAELTQAITDLINGADTDSDTLKELADKITALAQADNGLVSAGSAQTFNATQKKRARDNIDAAAKSDIPDISGLATKAESDTNYHNKAVTYTRTEMDSRYYTKTQSDANYHNKTVTYTRTEMDARYPLKAASYTKAESDGRYAKVWTGTLTEYNAITTKDGNTIYIVT